MEESLQQDAADCGKYSSSLMIEMQSSVKKGDESHKSSSNRNYMLLEFLGLIIAPLIAL